MSTEITNPQNNWPTTQINQQLVLGSQPRSKEKSVGIAYLFLIFLGIVGGHQFYLGKIGRGILYLFTGGLLGVGLVVDLFTLSSQTKTVNAWRK